MTPRERIIAALQHKEPDRIPVDLSGTDSTGINVFAYNNLKRHLDILSETSISDLPQMVARIEPIITKIVGSDVIPLMMEPKKWKPWKYKDKITINIPEKANLKELNNGDIILRSEGGIEISRCARNSLYFDSTNHPLENAQTISDIKNSDTLFKSSDWPYYLDEDFNDLGLKAQKLYNETEYAIVGNLYIHLFAIAQDLRGYENFLMDLVSNKPLAHYILEKQLEAYLPRIDNYIKAVGKYVQLIQVNDDLGTQNGLLIEPDLYRKMIKPYHKRLWNYLKEKSKKPILLHSCGSVYEVIPDFIEMGVDALNPIQVSANNMDTKKLKKEFGKDITFWGGGCDTQSILPGGSPEDVKKEVRKRINDLSSGGGFVFSQVHNIQSDVPVENILAMYEAAGTLNI